MLTVFRLEWVYSIYIYIYLYKYYFTGTRRHAFLVIFACRRIASRSPNCRLSMTFTQPGGKYTSCRLSGLFGVELSSITGTITYAVLLSVRAKFSHSHTRTPCRWQFILSSGGLIHNNWHFALPCTPCTSCNSFIKRVSKLDFHFLGAALCDRFICEYRNTTAVLMLSFGVCPRRVKHAIFVNQHRHTPRDQLASSGDGDDDDGGGGGGKLPLQNRKRLLNSKTGHRNVRYLLASLCFSDHCRP